MSETSLQRGVREYIDLLNRTSPHAPYNTTHLNLRALYQVHGQKAVERELDRQFCEGNEDRSICG